MEILGRPHGTRVHGTRIAWGEMGSGPPLVLLHGLSDCHRSWRRVAPGLARDFRVLLPDLPGHGWSGRPDAPYTLRWYARTVASWMDAIGVEQAHVCGHSLGGGIALMMLREQRPKVHRLALVATGGLGREIGIGMRLAAIPHLGPLLAPPLMRLGAPLLLRLFPGAAGNIEPDEARLLVHMNRIPGTDRAFTRTLSGVVDVFGQSQQMLPHADEIRSPPPMEVFWGLRDPIIPLSHGEALVRHSRGIRLHAYPGCGHFPHLEAPERFVRDLRRFLSDPGRPPARLFATGAPRRAGAPALAFA